MRPAANAHAEHEGPGSGNLSPAAPDGGALDDRAGCRVGARLSPRPVGGARPHPLRRAHRVHPGGGPGAAGECRLRFLPAADQQRHLGLLLDGIPLPLRRAL